MMGKTKTNVAVSCALVLVALGLLFVHLYVKVPASDALRKKDTADAETENNELGFFGEVARPVVGILTQADPLGVEYIAASYVKYAEAAGALVVPIRYTWSEKKLKEVFKGLNGILFPGGSASVDPASANGIYRAASVLYAEAERLNAAGKHFPIWGTCLGWELMATLASSYSTLTDSGHFVHEGSDSITEIDKDSKLFSKIPFSLMLELRMKRKLVFFAHHDGVTPETFKSSMNPKCWKIVALGKDTKGKAFVAAAESTCRPYYGVQFHPEKSLFEWSTTLNIPHSFAATELTRHFISFLSKELRKSRETSVKVNWAYENGIYRYPLVTGDSKSYFFQRYVFPQSNSTLLKSEDAEADDESLEVADIAVA